MVATPIDLQTAVAGLAKSSTEMANLADWASFRARSIQSLIGSTSGAIGFAYAVDARDAEKRLLPLAADKGVAVRRAAARTRAPTEQGAGPAGAGVGTEGTRCADVRATPAEVRDLASGGDGGDPRHQPAATHDREYGGRPRASARRQAARTHRRDLDGLTGHRPYLNFGVAVSLSVPGT